MRITFSGLERAGRLGNQLWQVAATIGLARSLGAEPHVRADWSYRPWFNLPEEFYSDEGQDWLEADACTRQLAHIDPKARMYLQDLGLFAHVADEVRHAFRPSGEAMAKLSRAADDFEGLPLSDEGRWDAVALHVRRGDTVTQPKGFQPLAPIQYYRNALATLPALAVVVFSDDPGWCRRHLAPAIGGAMVVDHGNGRSHKPAHYARQPATDWLDLQLMACFTHHVISNSTYAWWGAWLSRDTEVRYPEVWWGPNLAHIDPSLMIPPDWTEVPC